MARLLYVINIPRFFTSHRLPLAMAAAKVGYDVHVAASDGDEENARIIRSAGFAFHPLPMAQHGTHPLKEAQALSAVVGLYRRVRPDIVHHVSIKPVLYGGIAARLAGVRAVVGAMSGLGYVFGDESAKARVIREATRPLLLFALRHPNSRMIFQNRGDRQTFIDLGLVAADRTVLIRGSGVDTEKFLPRPENTGTPVVVLPGRLLGKKGVREFAEAAKLLAGRARFAIVGYAEPTSPDAIPDSEVEQWVRDGVVEWWGRRDDMWQVLADSNIVCLPTHREGLPKALIEAASCGRAIVATDIPGCREVVRHRENGLLVPVKQPRALADALEALIADPQRRSAYGECGRNIAVSEFALPLVLEQTLNLYGRLLA